ncbi:MAG: AIM24 family protein [Actinobacteria bacterium]|nr:AIM24 family protein [Actinomycetota bacterium]
MRLTTDGDAAMRVTDVFGLDVATTVESPVRIRREHLAAVTMDVEIIDEHPPDVIKGLAGGAGQVELSRVEGRGRVSLRPAGRSLRVFEMTQPITLLDPSVIIAVDTAIDIALGEKLDRSLGLARPARNAWELGGRGLIALGTRGHAEVREVTPDAPLIVEVGALVAYSRGIVMSEADDYRSRVAARGVKRVLGTVFEKLGVPLKLDGGRDRIWVVVEGGGFIVVQSVVD